MLGLAVQTAGEKERKILEVVTALIRAGTETNPFWGVDAFDKLPTHGTTPPFTAKALRLLATLVKNCSDQFNMEIPILTSNTVCTNAERLIFETRYVVLHSCILVAKWPL